MLCLSDEEQEVLMFRLHNLDQMLQPCVNFTKVDYIREELVKVSKGLVHVADMVETEMIG